MEQFKPSQVIMLLTNNYTTIFKDIVDNKLYLSKDIKGKWDTDKEWFNSYNKTRYQPQHLYIISDDKIEDGDLHITSDHSGFGFRKYKIIATTDTSLNYETPFYGMDEDNNFPQPSQQFIEKYIESYNKGEVITDVLVEYERHYNPQVYGTAAEKYSIVDRLKINPKDNTITIKKLKDSWNREEVKQFAIKAFQAGFDYCGASHLGCPDESNWIEENL